MENIELNMSSPESFYYYVIDYYSVKKTKSYENYMVSDSLYDKAYQLISVHYLDSFSYKSLFFLVYYPLNNFLVDIDLFKSDNSKTEFSLYEYLVRYVSSFYKKYKSDMSFALDKLSYSLNKDELDYLNGLYQDLSIKMEERIPPFENAFIKKDSPSDDILLNGDTYCINGTCYSIKEHGDKFDIIDIINNKTLAEDTDLVLCALNNAFYYIKTNSLYYYSFVNNKEEMIYEFNDNKHKCSYRIFEEKIVIEYNTGLYLFDVISSELVKIYDGIISDFHVSDNYIFIETGENDILLYSYDVKELIDDLKIKGKYLASKTDYLFLMDEERLFLYNILSNEMIYVSLNSPDEIKEDEEFIYFIYRNVIPGTIIFDCSTGKTECFNQSVRKMAFIGTDIKMVITDKNIFFNDMPILDIYGYIGFDDYRIFYLNQDEELSFYDLIKKKEYSFSLKSKGFLKLVFNGNFLYYLDITGILYINDMNKEDYILADQNVKDFLINGENIIIYKTEKSYFEIDRVMHNKQSYEIKSFEYNTIYYLNSITFKKENTFCLDYPSDYKDKRTEISYVKLSNCVKEDMQKTDLKAIKEKLREGKELTVFEKNFIARRIKRINNFYLFIVFVFFLILIYSVYLYFSGNLEEILINL